MSGFLYITYLIIIKKLSYKFFVLFFKEVKIDNNKSFLENFKNEVFILKF
jgi:hypothetical protein